MSSKPAAVTLDHVSKLYFKQEQKTFKEFLPALLTGKQTSEWFWALRDISLNIGKGETVGVIGRNGSGKSTFLKMIAGVSLPTEGKVKVKGRIAPLIELGAGFHPELTGRENIFLNGVILGMKHKEVQEKFQSIVNFSELEGFIDQPVKHYSSGMYLRLAFSVAIHTDPDVLLVDEILAVGDEAFQRKCFTRLREFQKNGTTIIYVSHALESVKTFCQRAILLDKGKLVAEGSAKSVVEKYYKEQVHIFDK